MSFSYSGDPASSILDECRFLLGDTTDTAPILQDEEINYIIAQSGSDKTLLCYNLFKRASTLFARDIRRSLGPQSEDPTSRLEFFMSEAESYKRKLHARGISIPSYGGPKVFYKGMQNNPPWPKPNRR